MSRILVFLLSACLALPVLAEGGSTTLPTGPSSEPAGTWTAVEVDPYEGFNRQVFAFNTWLVSNVVNPTADWLGWLLPQPVQQAGSNMYNNLVEPEFIVTNWLDGDNDAALVSGQRFLINSTLGVAGVWDAASWLGYERREVEFIESLCSAGVDPGPYVMLPAIGSASVYPAVMVTGFFAVEWYALSYVSATLATADLVVDVSASAASLRHARDMPDGQDLDPYLAQRAEFLRYVESHCAAPAVSGA